MPIPDRRTISLVTIAAGRGVPSSSRLLADQLTSAVRHSLRLTGIEAEVHVVELREYAHDIVDALLDPFPDSRLAQVFERIREADAVVAVTPIFNMGPSGLFKTFVDAGDKDLWENKPLLLGATAGTSRHSLAIDFAIRPLFSYLRARVVPTAVFAASADLGAASPTEIDGDPLWQRAQRAATELLDLLEVGRTSRPTFPATPAEFDPGS